MNPTNFVMYSQPRPETDWRQDGDGCVVVFQAGKVLLLDDGRFPRPLEVPEAPMAMLIGHLDDRRCYALELDGPGPDDWFDLRVALSMIGPGELQAVSRARILLNWHRQNRYCGCCGSMTGFAPDDMAIVCPDCRARYYPQIAPAVIVLVTRGRDVLLAHNSRFRDGLYGLIAGFVEAGESVEDAVRREIAEEIGIRVGELRYIRSQPWPFPNSLMFGFEAEYLDGDITPDGSEITDAQWFTLDSLPTIPHRGSIARSILERFAGYTIEGDFLPPR